MTITTRFHDRWTTYDIAASVSFAVLFHSVFGVTDKQTQK